MTTDISTRPTTPRSSHVSQRRRWSASGLLAAVALSACASSAPATTRPGSDPDQSETTLTATDDVVTAVDASTTAPGGFIVESRREIGPRALDADAAVMMVVDSVDVSGDDIFVRVRVVNGSDRFLNVGAEDNLYGPLLEMRDDRDNTYPARAVEPAGVDSYSVGGMRFRLTGPFDRGADAFTVEIATSRGRLTTDPIPVPDSDVVTWWNESPAVAFSDLVGSDQDNRTVQVVDIVDRGTHVDVAIRASDDAGVFTIPDDANATLTLADGTELESLPLENPAAQQPNVFTGVLRFVGTLPSGPTVVSLRMADVVVEIPLNCADVACPAHAPASGIEPPFAAVPRLPDLLHFDVKPEPLPSSTITIAS